LVSLGYRKLPIPLDMKHLLTSILVFVFIGQLSSQTWTLKDIGVGLITEDENYDKELKIVKRGNLWDYKDLYDGGAMAGKYNGNQLFGAWIVGPPSEEYKNNYGIPIYLWGYKITYPDGKTYEAGNYGFYTPGFGYFGIKPGSYTEGKFKIDFHIWNRDTNETIQVGSTEFTLTNGK
jgi:hypothetical protein